MITENTRNGMRDMALLAMVLLLEVWLFTGAFGKFFNHDSLFYMIYSPGSWQELQRLLLAPDESQQYRPLTLALTGLVKPYFGLDPRPYHWIPILFHMLNTILFWVLAKRLLGYRLGAFAALGFWSLHSVAGWITYDITYLSDFLMAFFFLASLILGIDGYLQKSPVRIAASLTLFAGALLSKEAAIMLPVALFVCLGLAPLRNRGGRLSNAEIMACFTRALPMTGLYLVLSLLHAGILGSWLREGLLYGHRPDAAYSIDPWANPAAKMKYIYWALNLPDTLSIDHPNRNRALALLLMAIPLLLWLFDVVRRRGRLEPVEWSGWIWLAGTNVPALLLSQRLAKWYLYIPLMGLALAYGSLAPRLVGWLPRSASRQRAPAVLALLLVPVLFSSRVQTRSFLNSSDSSYASTVVESCLKDFRNLRPSIPPEVTLYLLPTFEKSVAEFFGNGRLYQLFYPNSRIEMLFADRGDPLPPNFRDRREFWVLQYLYGHVHDVSDYYKGRRWDASARYLTPSLDNVRASVSREEFYYEYEHFETPGGTPVFFPTPTKDIFTQIGGSTAVLPLDDIPSGASLRFDVSFMHDQGDGAWAEMRIRTSEKESVLFREYMNPNLKGQGLRWKEVQVDLSPFAHQDAELVLRCYNSVGKNTVADWLNWRYLVLQSPAHEVVQVTPHQP